MSNHDQTPRNSNSSAPEQVPHSGVHGYERPVDEFDNTTLAEAHEQGLLTTPDTAARLADEAQVDTQTTIEPPKNGNRRTTKEELPWYKKKVVKIAGAVMGLVGAGAAVVATQGGDNTAPVTPEQTNSAPADPNETSSETSLNTPPEASEIQLSAETYQTPEEVVSGWVSAYDEWRLSGANQETKDNTTYDFGSLEDYLDTVTYPLDDAYADALLVDNWRSNSNLVKFFDFMQGSHSLYVQLNWKTTDTSEDTQPYTRETVIEDINIISASDTEIIADYTYSSIDNSELNRADSLAPFSLDTTGTIPVKFVIGSDNVWRLADTIVNNDI